MLTFSAKPSYEVSVAGTLGDGASAYGVTKFCSKPNTMSATQGDIYTCTSDAM